MPPQETFGKRCPNCKGSAGIWWAQPGYVSKHLPVHRAASFLVVSDEKAGPEAGVGTFILQFSDASWLFRSCSFLFFCSFTKSLLSPRSYFRWERWNTYLACITHQSSHEDI